MIRKAIKKIVSKTDLTINEMENVMNEIMRGSVTPAQIGSFITALRMKGECVNEITGAAKVMRDMCSKINIKTDNNIVDTCGTGGDGASTFNISTIAAFVTAGAGITVAKHGNRAVSSMCGSADLLLELGINIDIEPEGVENVINKIGIGFLFAPKLHGAMKYAIGPRREIGIRTIFNILGPLTNPAGAKHQVIGVYDESLTETLANVLKKLGSKHVFVVHGHDGLDEITLTGKTKISELKDGEVKTYTISPKDFGLNVCNISDLKGSDTKENAEIAKNILSGELGPKRDIVLLNSAAAIVAGDGADSIKDAIEIAKKSIDSGKALEKLNQLIKETNS